MQNTLGDLNNHLFAQLERLSDEDLKGEALQEEIVRSKAINSVAQQIIANGSLVLEAKRLQDDRMNAETKLLIQVDGSLHSSRKEIYQPIGCQSDLRG